MGQRRTNQKFRKNFETMKMKTQPTKTYELSESTDQISEEILEKK